MAGAGYKLFNTGDVLTAAQVNTYLMQQTTMVFANSAARTSALSGVLAEGMVSYLQDTNTLEVYDGSSWVGATGDITGLTAGTGISISSATGPVPTITNTVATEFDALGDLIVGTGADTFDKLTVGSNGETLVADSSATTGLRWQGNYAAGKNKIINGDFNINQRAFTSTTTSGTFGFDRWSCGFSGGTVTYSAQTFTPGAAPVAGYEGTNFARVLTSGQSAAGNYAALVQNIENVRTLAGQTVTVSFWAKAASGTPKVFIELAQQFGSGGTPSSDVLVPTGSVTLSTSWARYSATVTMPSISGKTIGTNTNSSYIILNLWVSAGTTFDSRTSSLGIQNNTFDFWGVQLEAGSVATAFQTATGTLAGELAACQRYYFRAGGDDAYQIYGVGIFDATTSAKVLINLPATMRIAPTSVDFSTIQMSDLYAASSAATGLTIDKASKNAVSINLTGGASQTQGRTAFARSNNSTSAYIGFSAEL